MNAKTHPYPPLTIVASRLQGDTTPATGSALVGDGTDTPISTTLPDWIRERINRVAEHRAIPAPTSPQAGQIWSFAGTPRDDAAARPARIPVLLDSLVQNGTWTGWAVAPDTDYASDADVVLNPGAQDIAPAAGMVQTWNACSVTWDAAAPFLGHVDEQTLKAIRAVAATARYPSASTGMLCTLQMREVGPNLFAVTGAPLGGTDDPRWQYRQHYRDATRALEPSHDDYEDFDV